MPGPVEVPARQLSSGAAVPRPPPPSGPPLGGGWKLPVGEMSPPLAPQRVRPLGHPQPLPRGCPAKVPPSWNPPRSPVPPLCPPSPLGPHGSPHGQHSRVPQPLPPSLLPRHVPHGARREPACQSLVPKPLPGHFSYAKRCLLLCFRVTLSAADRFAHPPVTRELVRRHVALFHPGCPQT